jgi:hypothetical protein
MAILRESEQKFPFMATMGNMPDLPWDIMSFGPRQFKNPLFAPKKLDIANF